MPSLLRPRVGRLASRAALICSGVLRSGSESLTLSFARETWRLCRFANLLSIHAYGNSLAMSPLLWSSPANSGILARWPTRRFSLPRSGVSRCQTILCVKAHLFFGEDQRALLLALVASFQDSPAH